METERDGIVIYPIESTEPEYDSYDERWRASTWTSLTER